MYNLDYLHQLEMSKRHFFGLRSFDSRKISEEMQRVYYPPLGVRILECYEDVNGEWVPDSVS